MFLGFLLLAVLVVGLVVYVVREATHLKATATSLQFELRQFKEGGFDRLIGDKLSALTTKALQELETRERLIQQSRGELVEHQKKAAEAVEKFKTDLGMVREKLTGLGELSGKVGELNDLLKPQQLRGELGEVIVRTLIADKLPRSQYEEDHTFADGKKVEFAIRLNDRLVPVDSKLQLDAFKRLREAADERQRATLRTEFKRAVKQKIDEVKQYIRPQEGTYNFALMVIPSEAVYYDLVASKDFIEDGGLYDYARSQNVFLASPLTFWAYISAIAHGLHGLEIERRADEILTHLQTLAKDIRQFAQDEFRKLGAHLRNAAGQYDEAERKLRGIEDDLSALERVEVETLTTRSFTP